MKRSASTLVAVAALGMLAAGLAAPASAGDAPAPAGSVLGDWKTRAAGFKQTVTFEADGSVHGNAGCNQFMGTYRVRKGTIEIGPLASTLKYCEGRMDAEQDFLVALQSATTYRATDAVLKLTGPDTSLRLKVD